MDEELEQTSCQIIAAAGTARSCYIEAIKRAEEGDFEGAERLIVQGKEAFTMAHDAHFGLIQKEAQGEKSGFALILMHAEDQLMSAEAFGILAQQFIGMEKRICSLEKEVAELEETKAR